MSAIAAGVSIANNQMLRRVEARPLALVAGVAFMVTSGALLAVTAAAGGLPRIGVWMLLFSLANASMIGFAPVAISLALEPMGALAGTAAAVVGFCSTGLGALLAAITDRAIAGDVMPIGVSYFAYGALALTCQLWTRRASKRARF
ncbi:hypothetical protein [Candidatus Poriferisodalis sp.]|uniref:hypothetical protein n=1 Tax=Candidatus Poriferisodalis sp. TaxID=3101277 RepID=UPI003C6ED5B4